MRKLLALCIGVLYMLPQNATWAQMPHLNLKFGNPTQEELEMKVYAADTSASAVVLCRQQDLYYLFERDKFVTVTEIKKRVKILKENGIDEANVIIDYISPNGNPPLTEEVLGLKAAAYNLENGKVVKTKMKSEQVFDERLNERHVLKKFTIPQVKVGTVIEYEYKLHSDFYYDVDDWYAQSFLPTLYTSYRLTIPDWFEFNVEQTGWERLENSMNERHSGFIIGGKPIQASATEYTYVGKALPALHADEFIWSISDYATKVTTELSKVRIPNTFIQNFAQSWESVIKNLMDIEDFGGRLKQRNPLKDEMRTLGIYEQASAKDKLLSCINLLQQHVRWNGDYRLTSKGNPFKEGVGSNADMNFVLIQMLRDAGIEAYPVLLRMRNSGRIPISHPTLQAFNTFIVAAPLPDDKVAYVDASMADGYLNVLPSSLLTDQAYALNAGTNNPWINLQSISSGKTNTIIEAELTEDGMMTGTITNMYQNNVALAFRQEFKIAKDSISFVNDIARKNNLEISNYSLKGQHGFRPSAEEAMTFSRSCDAMDGRIYVNPFPILPIKETWFKAEKRKLPVEFPFPQSESITVRIALPSGYIVEEQPQNVALRMAGGDAVLQRLCQTEEGILIMTYKLTINKLYFAPDEYSNLKAFFDAVYGHVQDVFVLKKAS